MPQSERKREIARRRRRLKTSQRLAKQVAIKAAAEKKAATGRTATTQE